jgi:katanin p60 ATPase-containing subunit A1
LYFIKKSHLDIPLPTRIGRSALFKLNLKSLNCGNNINWEIIYEKTDGYSGADIANVCREAAMLPIRRKVKEKGGFLMIGDDQSML